MLRLEEAAARRESELGASKKLREHEWVRQQVPSLPSLLSLHRHPTLTLYLHSRHLALLLLLTLPTLIAPITLNLTLPSLATSSFRPRRAAPQQPAVNNRPSRHRHHRSGACLSRRTLLHIAPRRAARVAAARPFSRRWRAARARTATASRPLCYTARGASAASAAVSRTLSPAAAAAAASEMPSPAAAAPTHDRRPRLQACATLGAHSTLLPRPRSALYSTRRSRHLVAAGLRAALNGPTPTLTLMPLSPVCPAGLNAPGRASTVRVPHPALIPTSSSATGWGRPHTP